LAGSGLLTSDANRFIMQNAAAVLNGLKPLEDGAAAITNIANRIDVAMNGAGRRGYGGRR